MVRIVIRNLKEEEIETVMDIWLESTIKGHPFLPDSYWKQQYETVKTIYIPLAETYVYEKDNRIAGFISVLEGNFIPFNRY